jgi:hypothetical protein
MQIGILPGGDLGLFPDEACLTLQSLPVPFDKLGLAVVSNEAEGVHTEAVHVSVGPHDAVASHGPEQCVQRAGLLAKEVPGGIMCRCSLRDLAIWVGFDGVDEVREFYGVLDEEDGDIIANNICLKQHILSLTLSICKFSCSTCKLTEVALVGVESRGEPMDISSCIRTTTTPRDCGKAHEHGCLFILGTEE